MSRSKLGLLGLCVMALSLMAFAADSASAAEWLILNSGGAVKTAKELNASLVSEIEFGTVGALLTHLAGLSIGILCKHATLENAKLVGGGGVSSIFQKATFASCTVVEEPKGTSLAGCTVKSNGAETGFVSSKEGKGQLQSNGEILIESNTIAEELKKIVGVLAELKFGGPECPLAVLGTTPVKGVLWIKDCEGKVETHLVKHLIIESTAHGHTLWLGADTAEHLETSVDGSALVFLSGEHAGMEWGATLP